MEFNVTKRNGKKELFDAEKINETIEWACEGLPRVSSSQVAMSAHIQFYDGISSKDIHSLLITSAANLISEQEPYYQNVAGRLMLFDIRKEVFGQFEPEDFYTHICDIIKLGKYDKEITQYYSKEEIDILGDYINHDLDLNFTYAAMMEWKSKYLVKDKVTNQLYESPQQALMLIGMCLHQSEPKHKRMRLVKEFYDKISSQSISLPTPIMAGVRTLTRQFSSCTLIESDDSLDSINATASAVVKYASKRAGIGINGGKIRAEGSPIRGGEAVHTGCIGFYKYWQQALKSCSQGAIRDAAATLFYPFFHPEIESLLVLKNNKGTEDNRVRHMDYSIQFSELAYKRFIKGEDISLFSSNVCGDLYEKFYAPSDVFEEAYVKLENDPLVPRTTIPAKDLFTLFGNERSSTGRIYLQNIDHCNNNSPFDYTQAPIKQSNLCNEISLPTKPIQDVNTDEGEIALCTLAAFNLAHTDDLQQSANVLVRALDNLLDYQDYPVKAAEKNKLRRTLGIGVTNFAYWLAKNGLKYTNESDNKDVHKLFEEIQYCLLKASNDLAKEKGQCELFHETTYSQGILPIDRYNKNVDDLVEPIYYMDWERLRKDIGIFGLRNSTLSALMPAETSSKINNSTNGIEPVRSLITVKGSKDSYYKQVVPEIEELKGKYEQVWDAGLGFNRGYLSKVAIMQKFNCQAISANTNYDPRNYPKGKVPLKEVLQDIFFARKYGVKTLYYHNTRDGSGEDIEDTSGGCAGGACSI